MRHRIGVDWSTSSRGLPAASGDGKDGDREAKCVTTCVTQHWDAGEYD